MTRLTGTESTPGHRRSVPDLLGREDLFEP
jgi:hypothetical protein